MKNLIFLSIISLVVCTSAQETTTTGDVETTTEVERFRCYQCNSKDVSSCAVAQNIDEWKIQYCHPDTTQCAVWVAFDQTYRGCNQGVLIAQQNETCSTSLCNFQVFPKDRTQCYKCKGEACVKLNETTIVPSPCVNKPKDECYTLIAAENDAYRGCVNDDIEKEGGIKCAESEYCKKGIELNDHPSTEPGRQCQQCFSNSTTITTSGGVECIESGPSVNLQPCKPVLLGRPKQQCITIKAIDQIQRACAEPNDFTSECEQEDVECLRCASDDCNSNAYAGLACHQCELGKSCQSRWCIAKEREELACYLFEFENRTTGTVEAERGCLHSLEGQKKTECINGENNCKICDTENCNKKPTFQTCVSCKSETNADCAVLENPNQLPTIECKNYMDECGSYIAGGHTHRDCFSHNIECVPGYCNRCEKNNCNNQRFPANRLQCYQCTGSDCAKDLTGSFNYMKNCLMYRDGDNCYTFKSGEGQVTRGCLSDVDSQCEQQGTNCVKCDGSLCNTVPLLRPAALHCVKCSGDETCKWGFKESKAQLCSADVELTNTEECYSVTLGSGEVQRGCTNDDNVCNQSGVDCKKCVNSACNNANIATQKCVRCDSKSNEDCGKDEIETLSEECNNVVVEFETRGCYTLRDSDNHVVRGCFADLSDDNQQMCTENDQKCFKCVGDTCNTGKPPPTGVAPALKISLMLILSVSIVLQVL